MLFSYAARISHRTKDKGFIPLFFTELTSIDDSSLKQDGNTASQADLADDTPPAIGRVSGWAVSFERLLKDELGLRYFTVSFGDSSHCLMKIYLF